MYKLKILAVDDEPNMRSGIVRILNNYTLFLADIGENIEFKVDTADSGEQALEKIEIDKPDILLLDYKMPGISGMDVLERMDNKDGSITTIMITAFASLQTAVSAIKTGAFDFISKPFTPAELKAVVDKATQSLILARHVKKLEEEKRQVRFQFISVLGHELKAPLSAVEGYLYMLRDASLGENLKEYEQVLDRCLTRTEGMRKLILDILEMTKIESGTRVRNIEAINLNDIIKQSIEMVAAEASKKNIKISVNCPPDSTINADKMDIEIIFNNLISNAVKYNRMDGKIGIIISAQDNSINISVSDSGIGMTEEEMSKLFAEFIRIKNDKTKGIAGSGLGLSTVRKVAELYYGSVEVQSEPDKGSTFKVLLKDCIN